MARIKVHPCFYEHYKKGEFANICPMCGTEGHLSIAIKTELNFYDYLKLIRGNKISVKKDDVDLKTQPTVKCHNCDMNLLFALMRGDVELKDLETFDIRRPIKTREVIEKLDSLFED